MIKSFEEYTINESKIGDFFRKPIDNLGKKVAQSVIDKYVPPEEMKELHKKIGEIRSNLSVVTTDLSGDVAKNLTKLTADLGTDTESAQTVLNTFLGNFAENMKLTNQSIETISKDVVMISKTMEEFLTLIEKIVKNF